MQKEVRVYENAAVFGSILGYQYCSFGVMFFRDSSGKVTIKYAFWGNPAAIGVEEDILKEFHKEYPHIQVEPIATPYDDYHTKILTMIAGGLAPDVMRIDSYYFADFMEAQVLMPLDDLIERDEIDLSLYYEIGLPDSMYEGKMYGLPWERHHCIWLTMLKCSRMRE